MSGAHLGQALALGAAILFALASIFIIHGGRKDRRGDRGAALSVVMTAAISTLIWLLVEADPGNGLFASADFWPGVGWYALAGLLAIVLGRFLLFASIRDLGVVRASAVKRLSPFFSALLAFLLLAEPITGLDAVGMAMIVVAFAILIARSASIARPPAGEVDVLAADPKSPPIAHPKPIGYVPGVLSALFYGAAYVARKHGIEVLPMPAFGTMVGAFTGVVVLAVAAIVSPRYRGAFVNMFRYANGWLYAAGVLMSVAQVSVFAALQFEQVSTVVMITSLETFLAIFLAVIVFRTERLPDRMTSVAALLATAGVITVAAG